MNIHTITSEQEHTSFPLTGIVALCVAGVLTLVTHFAPWGVSANLAWTTVTAAAGLVGTISFLKSMDISRKRGKACLAPRRDLGTTIAFGAIKFAFAALLLWSLYSSSEDIKHAGNAALWFFFAFSRWEKWRESRHMPAST